MNVDAAYAQFGGRVALMYCLRELGGNAGIDVARFGGVDHETVGRLRAYAEEAWQQLGDARLFDDAFIEQTLAPFTEPFDNGIGLPVLKLSYLDNRNPDALSFAGVGATSIPRNQITSLSRCFCATIRGLGRPYARYYRKQHPEFESDATGLMIMGHLPTKDIWGTAWTHGRSWCWRCSRSSGVPIMRASPRPTMRGALQGSPASACRCSSRFSASARLRRTFRLPTSNTASTSRG